MKSLFVIFSFCIAYVTAFSQEKTEGIRTMPVEGARKESALTRIHEYPKTDSDSILILGQINAPGYYELKNATVATAVVAAGGSTRLGSLRHFYIFRDGTLLEYFTSAKQAASIDVKPKDCLFIEYQCTSYGASALTEPAVKK